MVSVHFFPFLNNHLLTSVQAYGDLNLIVSDLANQWSPLRDDLASFAVCLPICRRGRLYPASQPTNRAFGLEIVDMITADEVLHD